MSELAGKAAFSKCKERRHTEVDIKGFGRFRFRSLNEREMQRYRRSDIVFDDEGNITEDEEKSEQKNCLLVAMTLVDEDGNLVFNESDTEDMLEYDAAVMYELAAAAQKHCLGRSDTGGLVKNSEETLDAA